jgi:hypothetical protein
MAKGLNETGIGQSTMDDGRAHLIAGIVMAYANSDNDDRVNMYRHAAGIHADPKENKGAYADAWSYWRNLMIDAMEEAKIKSREAVETNAHMAPAKAKDDTMGSEERQSLNRLVNSRVAALKYACLILVAFDEARIDWEGVKLGARSVSVKVTISNARLLFGSKKKQSIDGLDLEETEYLSIKGNMSAFRFSNLAQHGEDILKARGVKKVAERKTADIQARRDALANVVGIADDDAKSYDEPADTSKALAAFVNIANALNDSTLTGARLDNIDYTAIDWIVEGMKAVRSGKPATTQYQALRQFVSNMLDKSVPADKKAA